jgi:hypothetical protein
MIDKLAKWLAGGIDGAIDKARNSGLKEKIKEALHKPVYQSPLNETSNNLNNYPYVNALPPPSPFNSGEFKSTGENTSPGTLFITGSVTGSYQPPKIREEIQVIMDDVKKHPEQWIFNTKRNVAPVQNYCSSLPNTVACHTYTNYETYHYATRLLGNLKLVIRMYDYNPCYAYPEEPSFGSELMHFEAVALGAVLFDAYYNLINKEKEEKKEQAKQTILQIVEKMKI